MIWPHATIKNPCPVCGKPDWCSFGDRAAICRRVESSKPHLDRGGNFDGWYHFYDSARPQIPPRKWTPPRPAINPQTIKTKTCGEDLAKELGVSMAALRTLGVGWSDQYQAWMFPMRNGKNEVVGWNRRFKDGSKKIVGGTKAGLYIPQMDFFDEAQPVVICEGGSDTAALLDLGFFAIGRFNVSSGAEDLKEFFQANNIHRCIIISDNDERKNLNGRQGRPGIEGALRLKKALKTKSVIWMPPTPCKDVRDFVNRGGTKELILSDVKNKVWTK
jgi:phage/plasmid primase-like uncharacterized protein